ncbi:PhnB protein [Paenibacillus sp. UNCCL117]|uniref:VOC family protein n=1 Tax=unclassified Paenibacillus TaxID=185978 RepID=UPI000884F07F|nr:MULTISPECIES: VOC family protein [unclassified Paenibacillus]SDE11014.1 PhnB protein [Paenibacillus sp. cl123]SFW59903.1 PhnB protein [Paenibacillus sp. UNCCL117]
MALQLTPSISLDGYAKEAISFYEQTLEAQVVFQQTYGEGPDPVSEKAKERIAHSILLIGATELYVNDTFPGQASQMGDGIQICITTPDTDKSQQLYDALQQGGHVVMPLQSIYFSPAFGVVTDKFGVTFQIYTQRPSA